MGKRDLVALLGLSSWCLVMIVWLFLALPLICLRFVIVVIPDHTHSLTIINVIANLFIMGSYLIINYAENYLSQQSLLSTDIRHVFVVNLHIIFPSMSGFPPT